MHYAKRITVTCSLFWLSLCGFALAQPVGRGSTVEGDLARGQGAFLQGAGWYNLRTAQANAVNVDATIRWKQDLRKIQSERMYLQTQKGMEKKQNVEELKKRIAEREQQLRTNPTPADVQSGAALNALVYDLTDPDIDSSQWKHVSPVSLPPGTSVKELIFSFTPHSVSTQASAALSRGVIALSRLDIKDKWPVLLKKDELSKERKAYEDAYLRVRDKVVRGDYAVEEILALDTALDGLKHKISSEIPLERGFRIQAANFVDDLRNATRMFDANSVDYAREILIDTKDHDAATVEELVAFMTKYRLQFTNSERSPTARVLYGQIYEKLCEQTKTLNIKPPGATPVEARWTSLFNGQDLAGWRLTGKNPDWKVVNGVLQGTGSPGNLHWIGPDLASFRLRLETKINQGGDSGIFLRTQKGEIHNSYHVDICRVPSKPQKSGSIWLFRNGINCMASTSDPILADGEWHVIEIVATEKKFVVLIDGATKVEYADERNFFPRGGLALENFKRGSIVEFRKIELLDENEGKR